jgi:organic radical activating enzyme
LNEIPVEIGPNQANIDKMKALFKKAQTHFSSPTFCSAKWLQTSINLAAGTTHSCHHPAPHKIPLEELENNPSALHNTIHKKKNRKLMLEGKRPAECSHCWQIEDLEGNYISDRCYKTADTQWSMNHLADIRKAGADGDINPSYLEIAFSNACNMKCIYCSSEYSSQWMDEAQKYGAYPTTWKNHDPNHLKNQDRWPYHPKEYNPYVEAYWKWFPTIYQSLNVLRVTGGEPLLHKDFWKLVDYIEANPRPQLDFVVNTNMCVPDKYIDQLIEAYKRLKNKVRSFEVYTSCESAEEQAEYIRDGMDFGRFTRNVERYLEETDRQSRVNFMITFNILSMTEKFIDFLSYILEWRRTYNETDSMNRLPFMISYLRWPTFLSPQVAPPHYKKEFAQKLQNYISLETTDTEPSKHLLRDGKVIRPLVGRFYLEEVDQVNRLCEFFLQADPNFNINRKDFWSYITTYDRRRKKEFEREFPELFMAFVEEDSVHE